MKIQQLKTCRVPDPAVPTMLRLGYAINPPNVQYAIYYSYVISRNAISNANTLFSRVGDTMERLST